MPNGTAITDAIAIIIILPQKGICYTSSCFTNGFGKVGDKVPVDLRNTGLKDIDKYKDKRYYTGTGKCNYQPLKAGTFTDPVFHLHISSHHILFICKPFY